MPKKHKSSYDFIVIGMGAGGATILQTLAQSGVSVIGLEAGGTHDFDPDIMDPLAAGSMEGSHTWDHLYNQETAPNPDLGERTMNYTTGRMLGGTSIKGMQYVSSDPQYWQQWHDLTGGIWTPDSVNAAYMKLERFVGTQYNPVAHGFQGSMQIRQAPGTQTAMATATGTSVIADYNEARTPVEFFTRWSLFQKPNRNRASSSTNFLTSILDKILVNTTVTTLQFDERNRIVGVKALHKGKEIHIKAKKEVIIACGIHSAELLLHSGIGPKQALKRLGIDTVFDNPNVGSVSRNHLINKAVFSANPANAPGTGGDPQDLQSIIAVYQKHITALNTELRAPDSQYQLISPPLDVIADTNKLTDFIKEEMDYTHHWTGTCRMGGVVDNKGRVYGVKGVRVADISVAPIQPNHNTAGIAIVVGYLIGQLLLQKHTCS